MARDRRKGQRGSEQEALRQPRLGPREAKALFAAVTDYRVRRYRFFDAALAPAMPAWSGFAEEYARYRRFTSAPSFAHGGNAPWADLWTFYALSRVFEWLTLGFQDLAGLRPSPDWPGPGPCFAPSPDRPRVALLRDELLRFFGAFGMEPMKVHPQYHPFFHEVAAAEPDPALGDAVLVEEEIWPGLWFGDLVFARAGVRVRCGPGAPFDAVIAAQSTLYFAWARVHRPTHDLSHGWGSGSQWATRFRRDYAGSTMLHYNVDGCVRLTDDASVPPPDCHRDPGTHGGLAPTERIELLRHRCFVRTAKPDRDLWPFDDTYAEPAPGPDWVW